MTPRRLIRTVAALGAATALASVVLLAQAPPVNPSGGAAKPGAIPTGMRRLTEQQYRNAIADIFGEEIQVAGRMEPIARLPHELQVDGVSRIGVSPAGTEEFDRMALTIAGQVVDDKHRGTLVVCKPRDVKAPDDECAARFILRTGRLIFRRPLSPTDVQTQVAAASEATRITKDFYKGLQLSLASMLVSPKFLFDLDTLEPDPARPGMKRLDGYSKATRLSLFLWNTTPDAGLLAAASRGDLHTKPGLAKQVDRLLASPRLEGGVRAFFSDMFEFEKMADLTKDPVIYPQFAREVKADMPEQTLRTLVDLLVRRNGDYRDVFTSRETFMTRPLGVVYGVPVEQSTGWVKYEFPQDSPRAGLLTQLSFLAANSHDGRSSPTLRGKALRELVLCQPVPDPPANVNFALVNDTKNETLKTVRDRLTVHRNNPACASCHRRMDPIGLSLENFDGVGAYRTQENGVPIDASGELDGTKFDDPVSLGRAVRDNPAVPACLVKRASEYALRRPLSEGESGWVKDLTSRFTSDGYRLRSLLRAIATSDTFFPVSSGASVPPASNKLAKKEVTQ
jgi:uncharacterized protein DUF1592/uncharacterized protein DUF1588/uncharacterized protein DUF1585/uncharacterized protein DUF1595/uncharacterized protein DUF1587